MRILDLCIVIGLAFPAQSVADDQRDKELANRSPYEVDLALDLPVTFVYDATLTDDERTTPDAGLSFYSGHTSTVFCMATAYSYTFTKRHPHSPLVIPVWLATHALAATTGVLRVEAGKHFWTDVLAGAAIGSAIGFLVPYLHTANRSKTTAGDSETRQLGVALGPALFEHGLGLGITIR